MLGFGDAVVESGSGVVSGFGVEPGPGSGVVGGGISVPVGDGVGPTVVVIGSSVVVVVVVVDDGGGVTGPPIHGFVAQATPPVHVAFGAPKQSHQD